MICTEHLVCSLSEQKKHLWALRPQSNNDWFKNLKEIMNRLNQTVSLNTTASSDLVCTTSASGWRSEQSPTVLPGQRRESLGFSKGQDLNEILQEGWPISTVQVLLASGFYWNLCSFNLISRRDKKNRTINISLQWIWFIESRYPDI